MRLWAHLLALLLNDAPLVAPAVPVAVDGDPMVVQVTASVLALVAVLQAPRVQLLPFRVRFQVACLVAQ